MLRCWAKNCCFNQFLFFVEKKAYVKKLQYTHKCMQLTKRVQAKRKLFSFGLKYVHVPTINICLK
jgi:hypothetical protein